MNKNRQKIVKRDREKTQAVYWVAQQFEVTPQYVYGILNGSHTAGRYEVIKKSFEEKYTELQSILQ